jgi:predicted transposase YbfD/YdcC
MEAKSNEITAIPALLEVLELAGCVVTIDAMGTQPEIAQTIVDQQADYVLALKENQSGLYQDVEATFEEADELAFTHVPHLCQDDEQGPWPGGSTQVLGN